jgi:hypothetical protein
MQRPRNNPPQKREVKRVLSRSCPPILWISSRRKNLDATSNVNIVVGFAATNVMPSPARDASAHNVALLASVARN